MSLSKREIWIISDVAAQEYIRNDRKPDAVLAIVKRTNATQLQAELMVEAIDDYEDQREQAEIDL